jgi:phosphohistidine phosphatase
MKTLFLIRHAKSSWNEPQLQDSERPLNKRGKHDAPFMANILYEKNENIDYIVTSPAKRARTTAKHFAKRFELKKSQIVQNEQLYLADEDDILDIIHTLPDTAGAAALFGHNPGYTYFANLYTNYYIDNVPTCAIVKLFSVCDNWVDFQTDNTRLAGFYYPKQFS